MFRRMISKAPGKEGTRPLTIPHKRDRLLLGALHVLLCWRLEPTFASSSHGFRPGGGCVTCFIDLENLKSVEGLILLDIKSCFDEVPHERLIRNVDELNLDYRVRRLLVNYLSTKIKDKEGADYMR